MLPRTRAPLMRVPHRGTRLPLLPIVLASIILMPLAVWMFMYETTSTKDVKKATLAERVRRQRLGTLQQTAAEQNKAPAVLNQSSSRGLFTWVPPQHIANAAKYRREAVLNPRKRLAVAPAKYVIEPEPHDMRAQHKKVLGYIASPAFKAKVAARKAGGKRGIIINAGGPNLITSTTVTLKVLREQLNCSLPVELVWHKPNEMDATTLAAMQSSFGPIIGVNLTEIPWPSHHRPKLHASDREWQHSNKYIGKVMSLTESSFASALFLDADNLPLADPHEFWEDAAFKSQGNLFWPDFWSEKRGSEMQSIVYDMVGLKYPEAADLLSAGKGHLQHRDTESGQILVDLVRHADVVELALWINTFGDSIYKAVWGDKDTYGLAFAVAGKAHEFTQVQVPPGGGFTWRPNKLLVKSTQATVSGYQLAAMVQFDSAGRPAFLHRTMNKFNWNGEAWPLEMISGPLPARWIHYYLSQDALGPTVGVPYDYVAPATAFVPWKVPMPFNISTVQQESKLSVMSEEACPSATFVTYWRLREHAVPIGSCPQLQTRCQPFLNHLLGSSAEPYAAAGLLHNPELLALGQTDFDQLAYTQSNPNPLVPAAEVPDSNPVLAWEAEYMRPAVASDVSRVLRASYEAFQWVQGQAQQFPILAQPLLQAPNRSAEVKLQQQPTIDAQ
eukprot:GHUV01009307.1.p1 GENE.GHUV01009307.1~~GHUV01009307.1.p1  ORF type:complete len:671 (+),score=115.05 GHUV01009307.1:370-2382(+)